MGFFGPISTTLMTEIIPKHIKGKIMALITVNLALGLIYGPIFLEDINLKD